MGRCQSGPWRWRCRCSGRWSAITGPWLGTCGPGRSGRARWRGAEADGIVNDDFRLLAVGPVRAIGVVAGVAGGGRRQLGWWLRDTDIGKPRQGRVVTCCAVTLRQARRREQGSSFIASFSVEFFSRAFVGDSQRQLAADVRRGVTRIAYGLALEFAHIFSGCKDRQCKPGNRRLAPRLAPGHPRFFSLPIPGQR